MSDTSPPKPVRGHASMPRFVAWIQDNLLLTLLIVASGYVNGIMLVDGWVPNLEDPNTWGILHGAGVGILFAAGLGMGGLALRISYKLSECYSRREWGRVVFLAFGMAVLSLVEFWASFSQRSANIHPSNADNAALAIFDIHNSSVSLTAILIAIVVPFVSVFWGFAAEDPAPAPVEDAVTVRARMENALLEAEYKARINQTRAHGIRAGIMGALGREDAPKSQGADADIPAEVGVFASQATGDLATDDGRITAEPPAISGLAEKGNWWDAQAYKDYVTFRYGAQNIGISLKRAAQIIDEVGGNKRIARANTPGKPSAYARVSALKKRAKSDFESADMPAASGVFAEQMAE